MFLAKIHYEMFPEMTEEFDVTKYPETQMHMMEVDNIDDNTAEYFLDLEIPYGTYKLQIFYKEIDKAGEYASGD